MKLNAFAMIEFAPHKLVILDSFLGNCYKVSTEFLEKFEKLEDSKE